MLCVALAHHKHNAILHHIKNKRKSCKRYLYTFVLFSWHFFFYFTLVSLSFFPCWHVCIVKSEKHSSLLLYFVFQIYFNFNGIIFFFVLLIFHFSFHLFFSVFANVDECTHDYNNNKNEKYLFVYVY